MKQPLNQLIEEFLAEHRESSGGWAEVTAGDMAQLYAIINRLIEEKFAPDPDGDYPIDYLLVNRTKEEPIMYTSPPYLIRANTEAELDAVYEAYQTNLEYALENMNQFIRVKRLRKK